MGVTPVYPNIFVQMCSKNKLLSEKHSNFLIECFCKVNGKIPKISHNWIVLICYNLYEVQCKDDYT